MPTVALAQGKPGSIDDCEQIKEPLAYNACLASFGPARNGQGPKVTEVPPDADRKVVKPAIRRGKVSRGRGGRARAEFSVGGKRSVAAPRKTPRAQRRPRRR